MMVGGGERGDGQNPSATDGKVVAWKLRVANPRYASIRYRCLMPLKGLQAKGYSSVVLDGEDDVKSFERVHAIIFVKSFADHDLDLAKRAHQAGVSIYIDLCDNVMVPDYGGGKGQSIRDNLQAMCALATALVTTGPELARVLRSQVPPTLQMKIVPDQVETLKLTQELLNTETWLSDPHGIVTRKPSPQNSFRRHLLKLLDPRLYWRALTEPSWTIAIVRNFYYREIQPGLVRNFIFSKICLRIFWMLPHFMRDSFGGRILRNPGVLLYPFKKRFSRRKTFDSTIPRKTVVWFGHHGADHGRYGMAALQDIVPSLIEADRKFPIRLLIISDNQIKYGQLFSKLSIPTEYRKWDPIRIFSDLQDGDVCVVPNTRDDFSITKSANRVILALSLGVPVVATRVPATEPLGDCIIHDDWVGGIVTYLGNPDRTEADIAKARDVIRRGYSVSVVARMWHIILSGKAREIT